MKTTLKTTVHALLLVCCMTLLCGVSAFAEAPDAELPVRVVTLNGTTGFGMAGLIAAHEAGETALNYSFTVDTDASTPPSAGRGSGRRRRSGSCRAADTAISLNPQRRLCARN